MFAFLYPIFYLESSQNQNQMAMSRLGILYRNYVLKLNFSYIKSHTLSKTRNRLKTGRLSYEYSQAEVLRPI